MCRDFRVPNWGHSVIGKLPVNPEFGPKSTILGHFQEILIFVGFTRFSTLKLAEILKISNLGEFVRPSEKECLKNTLENEVLQKKEMILKKETRRYA